MLSHISLLSTKSLQKRSQEFFLQQDTRRRRMQPSARHCDCLRPRSRSVVHAPKIRGRSIWVNRGTLYLLHVLIAERKAHSRSSSIALKLSRSKHGDSSSRKSPARDECNPTRNVAIDPGRGDPRVYPIRLSPRQRRARGPFDTRPPKSRAGVKEWTSRAGCAAGRFHGRTDPKDCAARLAVPASRVSAAVSTPEQPPIAGPANTSAEAPALVCDGHQVCKQDEGLANILLCDACNTQCHAHCLKSPLEKVPEGDLFCGES